MEEFEGVGMVVFDGLRDIDGVGVGVMIEDVAFGKIDVGGLAFVIHLASCEEEFSVQVGVGGRGDMGFRIFESR